MCKHEEFEGKIAVARLEDSGRFQAEITIRCKQCGEEFQFLGLEPGVDLNGARVSIDGLEAHLAICPKSSKPSPLQRMVTGFDVKQ